MLVFPLIELEGAQDSCWAGLLSTGLVGLHSKKLGERTVHLDCDVLQADGGTRTASITGAFVAAQDAVDWLMHQGKLAESPIIDSVAAISVGLKDGTPLLDLDYTED